MRTLMMLAMTCVMAVPAMAVQPYDAKDAATASSTTNYLKWQDYSELKSNCAGLATELEQLIQDAEDNCVTVQSFQQLALDEWNDDQTFFASQHTIIDNNRQIAIPAHQNATSNFLNWLELGNPAKWLAINTINAIVNEYNLSKSKFDGSTSLMNTMMNSYETHEEDLQDAIDSLQDDIDASCGCDCGGGGYGGP